VVDSVMIQVNRLPLEGMKRKVLRNLRLLESENLVSSSDDYQDIINAIAKVGECQLIVPLLCYCCVNNIVEWIVEIYLYSFRIFVINIDIDSNVNKS